jgi:hypothetical protein
MSPVGSPGSGCFSRTWLSQAVGVFGGVAFAPLAV